jgi:hypothetical protein
VTIRPNKIEKIARSERPDHFQSACITTSARTGQSTIQKLSEKRPAMYAEKGAAVERSDGRSAPPAAITLEREATRGFYRPGHPEPFAMSS